MAVNHLSLCNYQQPTCKSMNSSSSLHPWNDATTQTSQPQHFSTQGHFLGMEVKHPNTIYIIPCLWPESRDVYKEQAGKQTEKKVAFLFPSWGETEGARRRVKPGVSFSNSIAGTLGSKVIVWSCDLDSRCWKSLMKSASNPFSMCHLWLDNMMDGPFYSLFHLLCCSKLYFPFPGCFYLKHPFLCDMVIHQGSGSNVPRLSGGWGETHKPQQSLCISSLHCQFEYALLKKRKTLEICTHIAAFCTQFQLRSRCLFRS